MWQLSIGGREVILEGIVRVRRAVEWTNRPAPDRGSERAEPDLRSALHRAPAPPDNCSPTNTTAVRRRSRRTARGARRAGRRDAARHRVLPAGGARQRDGARRLGDRGPARELRGRGIRAGRLGHAARAARRRAVHAGRLPLVARRRRGARAWRARQRRGRRSGSASSPRRRRATCTRSPASTPSTCPWSCAPSIASRGRRGGRSPARSRSPAPPQRVLVGEFDTVLTQGDCNANPSGPGC